MSYSTTAITDPRVQRQDAELVITWGTTAPGSTYQVYLDGVLAWSGLATMAVFPWPYTDVDIDIGTVDPADAITSFASSLPARPSRRAALNWEGGTFLSPSLAAFLVYSGTVPGGAVSFAAPVATIAAYDGGFPTDGWGMGGWGHGGWGHAASNYTWTSKPLASGVWNFAIVAVDSAGNRQGTPTTASVTIAGPPNPPAVSPAGTRMAYTYAPSTRTATLSWLPSPA